MKNIVMKKIEYIAKTLCLKLDELDLNFKDTINVAGENYKAVLIGDSECWLYDYMENRSYLYTYAVTKDGDVYTVCYDIPEEEINDFDWDNLYKYDFYEAEECNSFDFDF